MRSWLLLSPLVLLSLLCGSCKGEPPELAASSDCLLVDGGPGPPGSVPFEVEVVAEGLVVPWGLAFLPGGDALVTERPGRIRLLRQGVLQPDPVATVEVAQSSEGGLLGIAAHPDFEASRQFYIYVTTGVTGAEQNRVERWRLAEGGATATFERVILDGIPAARYHDGGRLRFGPDGMLYVGTGDAGKPDLSQDVSSPAGKLLRLTPEGDIPPGNPFPGKAAFLLGIRNTAGFDWRDRDTLYITDHGPSGELNRSGHDEVHLARRGDNLGWPTLYGCQSGEGLVTPALTWRRAAPPGGAAVYTGTAIAEWKDSLLISTLGSQHLHRVAFEPRHPHRVAQHEVYLQNQWGRLREAIMGPDGHLYLTTSNCDGRGECGTRKDLILRLKR